MIFWHKILNEISHASWPQRFVWLNVVLFIAGALVVPKLASTTFTLLALAGIALLARERWPKDLAPVEKWLLLAFALYFVIGVVSYNLGIKTRLGWEILFRDIRFLFVIPAYLVLRRYPPPNWMFWLSVAIGAILLCASGVAEYLSAEGSWRVSGSTISIVFGHLAVSVVLLCLAGSVFLQKLRWRLLLLVAALTASVAVVLSGTRGAWVTLAGIGGLLFIYWFCRASRRQRLISGLGIFVVLMAAGVMFQEKFIGRLSDAIEETSMFFSDQRLITTMPEFGSAGCVNDPGFLVLFEKQRVLSGRGKLTFSLVHDPMLKNSKVGASCPTNFAIKVENTSEYRAWFYTPSRSVVPQNICNAIVLVRGQGAFEIPGGGKYRKAINTDEYKLVELHCEHASSYWPLAYRLIGLLNPGQTLYYVPVARYPGEYHYFYASTSVGARFAMWQVAWTVFLENPLIGAGTGSFPSVTPELVLAGKAPGITAWYDHPHNDYLTALSDRGLAGLAALLLLYGAPFWLFVQALRQTANRAEPVAGLLLVGGFMLSGLTETLFNHSLVITYYAVFISLLAVLSRQPPPEESS